MIEWEDSIPIEKLPTMIQVSFFHMFRLQRLCEYSIKCSSFYLTANTWIVNTYINRIINWDSNTF